MKKLASLGFIALAFCVLSTNVSFAADDEDEAEAAAGKEYSKKGLTLTYPDSGWTLEELPPIPNTNSINVRLQAKAVQNMSVIITFRDDLPTLSEKDLETPLPEVATAFALPIVSKMQEGVPSTAYPVFGNINLADTSAISARYIIARKDDDRYLSVEAFAEMFPPKSSLVGAILSSGTSDPKHFDSTYYDTMYEAYGIVQSITIKSGKKPSKENLPK